MLEINSLEIKYRDKSILKRQDLTFLRGELTGIQGKSGSGKSSLLNVLGLIKMPNKDCQYKLDNYNIAFAKDEEKAEFRMNHIGFIFQQGNLLKNQTVLGNVRIPNIMCNKDLSDSDKKAIYWLKYVGMDAFKNVYPDELSGGEEQRVAIARAMINDCDIILADEPTASLDKENREHIMDLLSKLAKDFNKIVIVVSHDDDVIKDCDTVYEIKDGLLEKTKSSQDKVSFNERQVDKEERFVANNKPKKSISNFIKIYDKTRRKEVKLNTFLIIITSIIIAITSLVSGYGNQILENQEELISNISGRSLDLANDKWGENITVPEEGGTVFTQDEIDYISKIANVSKVYPHYYFTSENYLEQKEDAKIVLKDNKGQVQKTLDSRDKHTDAPLFNVFPVYEEESLEKYLLTPTNKKIEENGIYLSYSLANKISKEPEKLVGQELDIYTYVPTKIYTLEASLTRGNSKDKDVREIESDEFARKLIKVSAKVDGIIERDVPYLRDPQYEDIVFMPNSRMMNIISENKEKTSTKALWAEKELAPNYLVLYARSFSDLKNIENKVTNYSPNINVINRNKDIEMSNQHLTKFKTTLTIVSIILIAVIMVMFALLYFFKNRSRNKEIGILKALGLSTKDVFRLISADMIKNSIKTFIMSVGISILIGGLVNCIYKMPVIQISPLSILMCLAISFLAVYIPGIFSVRKASKIDIIDSIRIYK